MNKYLLLFLILIPFACIQAQIVESFDGGWTEWVDDWASGDGYVIRSYDSTLVGHQGAAALKVEWKFDVVDYGGGISFARKVNAGENIDMSAYDTLTIWYYVEKPMTFEYKDSVAFSLILLDNPDQADYDANGTVEQWAFDAYGIFDNTVGWHEILIPLEESDDRTAGLVQQGDAMNGQFDVNAIKGFYTEWGAWETALVDTTNSIADSGIVYFDNMVLGAHRVPTAIGKNNNPVISGFSLGQNYPNPFNPSTVISYTLPKSEQVTLEIYDLLGRKVSSLVNRKQTAGSYQVKFSATNLTSGIYMYKITAGKYAETKRMVLVK